MKGHPGSSFDPETIGLMKIALDDAVAKLPVASRTSTVQAFMAERILQCASNGERDPIRLRTYALLTLETTTGPSLRAPPR